MGVRTCSFLICAASAVLAVRGDATPIPDDEMYEIVPMSQRDGTMTDTAQPTKMPWCPAKYTLDSWPTQRFREKISEHADFEGWADAAEHFCEHREDKTWVKQATYLVQKWMNENGVKQAEAEKQIADKIAQLKIDRSPAGKARAVEKEHEFMEDELTEIKADPGVDTAKVGDKVPWCDVVTIAKDDMYGERRIHRTLDARYGISGPIEGGMHLCERPTDTTWRQAARNSLQKWMNWTGQSQADAEKSLRFRMQTKKFEAQRDELCKTLDVDPELAGEERTYADARRDFFGCNNDKQTIWQDRGMMNTGGVGYYIDANPDPDPIMRAYWLFGYVRDAGDVELPSKRTDDNLPLLYYAVAQDDMAKVDLAATDKMLSASPYNDYARMVANETLSVLKLRQRRYEAALDKMTKGDDDYTTILRTAPKKAFADWDKLHTQWKAELDHSYAFEQLLSKPSRKVLKGCSVQLLKDAEKVIKAQKLTEYKPLLEKLQQDPVANILFGRLAICASYEKIYGLSGALQDIVKKGRDLRGPHSFAYYEIVDAIAEVSKDRPRLLLSLTNFSMGGSVLAGDTHFDARDFDMSGHVPFEFDRDDQNKGVIASTKKVEDGILIVWKTVKLKYPDYDCVDDTSHPSRIDSDGRIVYYQNCKPNGKTIVQDLTPESIVVSPAVAAVAKPGLFAQFTTGGGVAKSGEQFGILVNTKKKNDDKKILSFFGFEL